MTTVLLSFITALIAGIVSEIAIREIADTQAGFIPLAVMVCTFVITAAVLKIIGAIVRRVSP